MPDETRHDLLDPPAVAAPDEGDAPTVEAPATDVTASMDAAGSPPPGPPTAPTPAADPGPPSRSGMFVPRWALLVLAGLLVFGLGLAGGYALSDGDREGHRDDRDRTSSKDDDARRGPRGGIGTFGPRMGPGVGPDGRPGSRFGPRAGDPPGENGESRPTNPPGSTQTGTGFLGIRVEDSTDPAGAAVVRVVASSPADDAGLASSDVITAIDGTPVSTALELTQLVASHSPGDQVSITYDRDGTTTTVDITLGRRAQATQQ